MRVRSRELTKAHAHAVICRNGEFLNFLMNFLIVIGVFLHDLNNEEENECFIAAVDLEAYNVTDKVDNVTVDKAYQSTEVNKQEVGRTLAHLLVFPHTLISRSCRFLRARP